MLTALADVNDRIRCFELGVDDYLSKPFDPRELLLRVGSILRRVTAPPPGDQARCRDVPIPSRSEPSSTTSREATSRRTASWCA